MTFIDLLDWKFWLIEKTLPDMRYLKILFNLWKAFEINKVLNLLSNISLILFVMTSKPSAIDLEEWNQWSLSLRRLVIFRWSTTLLLIIDSKSLLVTLRSLMRWYCDRHTTETFDKLGKPYSLIVHPTQCPKVTKTRRILNADVRRINYEHMSDR